MCCHQKVREGATVRQVTAEGIPERRLRLELVNGDSAAIGGVALKEERAIGKANDEQTGLVDDGGAPWTHKTTGDTAHVHVPQQPVGALDPDVEHGLVCRVPLVLVDTKGKLAPRLKAWKKDIPDSFKRGANGDSVWFGRAPLARRCSARAWDLECMLAFSILTVLSTAISQMLSSARHQNVCTR